MPVLRVYVAAGCPGCDRAGELVRRLRAVRPTQDVDVVDLDALEHMPPQVVGTPTYVLGEGIVSLGNPSLERLLRLVDAAGAAHAEEGDGGDGDPGVDVVP